MHDFQTYISQCSSFIAKLTECLVTEGKTRLHVLGDSLYARKCGPYWVSRMFESAPVPEYLHEHCITCPKGAAQTPWLLSATCVHLTLANTSVFPLSHFCLRWSRASPRLYLFWILQAASMQICNSAAVSSGPVSVSSAGRLIPHTPTTRWRHGINVCSGCLASQRCGLSISDQVGFIYEANSTVPSRAGTSPQHTSFITESHALF